MVSFAIEWQVFMGTPFKDINELTLKKRMNENANPKIILPSQKLLKDLTRTIYNDDDNLRR